MIWCNLWRQEGSWGDVLRHCNRDSAYKARTQPERSWNAGRFYSDLQNLTILNLWWAWTQRERSGNAESFQCWGLNAAQMQGLLMTVDDHFCVQIHLFKPNRLERSQSQGTQIDPSEFSPGLWLFERLGRSWNAVWTPLECRGNIKVKNPLKIWTQCERSERRVNAGKFSHGNQYQLSTSSFYMYVVYLLLNGFSGAFTQKAGYYSTRYST